MSSEVENISSFCKFTNQGQAKFLPSFWATYYLCLEVGGKAQPDNDLSLFVLRTNKAEEQNELQVEMNPSPDLLL